MSDQEDPNSEHSGSPKPTVVDVSDQEAGEQDAILNAVVEDNNDSSKDADDLEVSEKFPQAEASVSQNVSSSFQLGSQEEQDDLFEADSDSDVGISAAIEAVTRDEEDSPPVKQKRRFLLDSDEDAQEKDGSPPPVKKSKIDDQSDDEGVQNEGVDSEGETAELQAEVADLHEGGADEGSRVELNEEGIVELGENSMVELGGEEVVGEEDEDASDKEPDEVEGGVSGMSDWDIMMQRRKDAMARARKTRRRREDGEDLGNDEHVAAMIGQMKMAAEDDRHLNMEQKAATKKLQMLPTVVTHLKKVDLITTFLDHNILSALSDWLTPLPDRSLPHLKIRESILDILKTFPVPDSSILKQSKIGKAVMLLYRHPKETRKNREKAGKIINEWARPIFGLASDFKSLTRDEREERDYAHLSQSKRKRLSTGERRPSQEDESDAQKPGDKGWVGRARVPMPSTNDYVVRPKWNVEQRLPKKSSKKVLNRYEKQLQKEKQSKMQSKTTHAVSISIEGRKMPL